MSHFPQALSIGDTIAGYEITRVLGRGGFGIVYAGRNPDVGLEAAIKEFFPTQFAVREGRGIVAANPRVEIYERLLDKFLDEARAVARIDHPNVGQANLGWFYSEGRGGLAKDEGEALRLYRLAVNQGNAQAQANIGLFYSQGRGGLVKNDHEAVRLFRLAVEQGNAWAQISLGIFVRDGRGGLAPDDLEAARLFRLSAAQGNARGQTHLADFYAQGRGGLPRDLDEARRLYKLAADQGHEAALDALARLARN